MLPRMTNVRRPFDGEVFVHYGQIYVESGDGFNPDLSEAFAGQSAGLCGGAVSGSLWLITGLHTGMVGFTVEVHDQAPDLDPVWEDVVEVSFRPASVDTKLVQWAGEDAWDLDLPEADYRVRYCAQGMDLAHDDTIVDDEPVLDRYLLQFWPAPPEADRIVRQTAEIASYWHDFASEQPPPPTAQERAEAEHLARLAREQAKREQRLASELRQWGGQLPSESLRAVVGNVHGLVEFDAELVHALDAAGPEVQRAVAVFAARRACVAAELADLDWVAAALSALAEGSPLPPPFDDREHLWQVVMSDPRIPDRTVARAVPPESPLPQRRDVMLRAPAPEQESATAASPPMSPIPAEPSEVYTVIGVGGPDLSVPVSQPHMAIPAVVGAARADPLSAAVDAVYAAVVTYGENYRELLADIWSACGVD